MAISQRSCYETCRLVAPGLFWKHQANVVQHDLTTAPSGGIEDTLLLQAAVFPRSDQSDSGGRALVNATGEGAIGTIVLPGAYENGSNIYIGDGGSGYPSELFPNFTWSSEQTHNVTCATYNDRRLYYDSTLLLGPLYLDSHSALISMTVAVNNNTSRTAILGWLTVVLDARILYNVANDPVGLGNTGQSLVVSAAPPDNLFAHEVRGRPASENAGVQVRFILPPASNKPLDDRHSIRKTRPDLPFSLQDFDCVLDAWSKVNGELNNAGSHISTVNEQGKLISCGYSQVRSDIVDWIVVLEQSHGEVFAPIRQLRNAVLICVFSVLGAVALICFPIAHFSVKPIRALRTATENSIMTYEAEIMRETASSFSDPESLKNYDQTITKGNVLSEKKSRKKSHQVRKRQFQIPQRVPDHRHIIEDELTDVTSAFNEMSDELKAQYSRMEDRVKTRTAELEHSRDLAKAANESKTLFIANVSHELRTPLNGIIGMCSLALLEEETHRIRQSLNIIYKSSDLLLHLLNDLLSFSRNSYGPGQQQLSIEERFFRLEDIGTQIVSIFEKQARESDIGLKVVFVGTDDPRQNFDDAPEDAIVAKKDIGRMLKRVKTNVLARGPADTGPLRQMSLAGDKNRILQVLMNFVSNSLKFTPAHGLVEVRIKCKGFFEQAVPVADADVESGASTAVQSSSAQSNMPGTSLPSSGRRLDFDFEVEDTGPGVPEHMRQEIFKPFVQGDLALSRKHGGTGLGLAICAQLASLMGGGIHLKSTVDIGSTFTLSLAMPYTKELVPSVAGSMNLGSRIGSMRPPSPGSSVRIEVLSNRSPRPPTRGGNRTQPPSVRVSVYSGHEDQPTLEQPRIVGFSQPYLTETKDDTENGNNEPANAEATKKAIATRNRLESIASVPVDAVEVQDMAPDGIGEKGKGLAQPPPTPKPRSMKVLVAEDNKINQEVIMRMLKLEKVPDATLAEDGQQALDIIRASLEEVPEGTKHSPFQLIFMDIQMPNMDGIEATKHIRELGFEAPIVALTAFDHETNREACRAAGMTEFLPKPLKRKPLRETLEHFRPQAEHQTSKED